MTRDLARLVLLCALPFGACTPRPKQPEPTLVAPKAPTAVPLVATAELRGTTEPCGCNSTPLGDLARVVPLVTGGLLLDGGNLLYDVGPISAETRRQADLKAGAIAKIYAEADVGLGPSDLTGGGERLAPARHACNFPPILELPLVKPHVREVAGLRVGVFGVTEVKPLHDANPALAWRNTARQLSKPSDEAKLAIASLRADHAEIVVALLSMPRAAARKVLEDAPGIDFGIVGIDVEEGMPEPEPVTTKGGGHAWLVAPADQGRRVAKIDVTRGDAPRGEPLQLTAFDGEASRARKLERMDRRKADLVAQLAAWRADKGADPSFMAARQHELDALAAERQRVATEALVAPKGASFTYALVPIGRTLPRDAATATALRELDREIGRTNFAAAKDVPPQPAEKNQPSYVGGAACGRCHKAALAFWQKTPHAHAWKTLVDVDKQYNRDCVGCHVTGWQVPGGSSLGSVEKQGLVDVQCEVCHGPGSKHVEEDGLDDPRTITKGPPSDLCRSRCHTKDHSDTFALDPYLRDILGAGHGDARRKALGDGPTAHDLRKAAMAK